LEETTISEITQTKTDKILIGNPFHLVTYLIEDYPVGTNNASNNFSWINEEETGFMFNSSLPETEIFVPCCKFKTDAGDVYNYEFLKNQYQLIVPLQITQPSLLNNVFINCENILLTTKDESGTKYIPKSTPCKPLLDYPIDVDFYVNKKKKEIINKKRINYIQYLQPVYCFMPNHDDKSFCSEEAIQKVNEMIYNYKHHSMEDEDLKYIAFEKELLNSPFVNQPIFRSFISHYDKELEDYCHKLGYNIKTNSNSEIVIIPNYEELNSTPCSYKYEKEDNFNIFFPSYTKEDVISIVNSYASSSLKLSDLNKHGFKLIVKQNKYKKRAIVTYSKDFPSQEEIICKFRIEVTISDMGKYSLLERLFYDFFLSKLCAYNGEVKIGETYITNELEIEDLMDEMKNKYGENIKFYEEKPEFINNVVTKSSLFHFYELTSSNSIMTITLL
jgi:hypothetical protein